MQTGDGQRRGMYQVTFSNASDRRWGPEMYSLWTIMLCTIEQFLETQGVALEFYDVDRIEGGIQFNLRLLSLSRKAS